MVGASLADGDWFDGVPGDLPAAVVAEGVFEYMEAGEVKALLNRLTSHFARGQVIFDCLSSFAVKSGRPQLAAKTGAVHTWAVDDIREVDALDVTLERIDALLVFQSRYADKLPWRFRLFFRAAALIPRFRNMHRLLRYEFPPRTTTPAA